MLSTLQMCEDISANNLEKALEILYSGESRKSVVVYHSDQKKLREMVDTIYAEIKARNTQISDINHQMLPANPYYWADIDGCLAVHCAEITMNTFENNAKSISLFCGWDYSVLTDPEARMGLSENAMISLALLGSRL